MANATGLSRVRFRILTGLIVLVLAVQAVGGLLIQGLYRDSPWVVAALQGTDILSLAVVIPLLVITGIYIRRGSLRARLAWMGTVYYIFYNNLYYLLSAYNRFFLVYVAIFIVTLFALIAALMDTDTGDVAGRIAERMPRKTIYLILVANAVVLCVMWIGQNINFIVTGQVPQIITDAGGSNHVVAALDLTLVVPPLFLGAALLKRGQAWGYVVSGVILVQCVLVTAGLTLTTPFVQAAAGIRNAWTMVPLFALMGVSFLAGTILLCSRITAGNADIG